MNNEKKDNPVYKQYAPLQQRPGSTSHNHMQPGTSGCGLVNFRAM